MDDCIKEGRYYWWNDCSENLNTARYLYGGKPLFPDAPFKNLTDFYFRIWQGTFIFVVRNNVPHIFKDKTMTIHRFLHEKNGVVLDPNDKKIAATLTKEDIELFSLLHWLDFKPHFDFKQFTLDDFLQYYHNQDLDGFFERYCLHSWIEIRPCSPHFENNAMDIPRYFYDIFKNLDEYIKSAKKISWRKARESRNSAIGYR